MMKRALSLGVASIVVCCASAVSAQNTTAVELQNQYSGKCLAVKGASSQHGAQLVHKECGTGDLDTMWEFAADSGKGGYRIRNANSRMCLGYAHGDDPEGHWDDKRVTQVDGCDRRDTNWLVETPGGVSVSLPFPYGAPVIVRNGRSNRCLALVTGTDIMQYGCRPSRPKVTWRFVAPPIAPPDPDTAVTVVSSITFSPSGVTPPSALLGSRDKPGTRAAINFLSTNRSKRDMDFVRIQHTFTIPSGSKIVKAFLRLRMEDDGDPVAEFMAMSEMVQVRTETGSDVQWLNVGYVGEGPRGTPEPMPQDYPFHFTAKDFKHFADGKFVVNIRAKSGDFYLHESVLTVVYYPPTPK